jgi:transposase
MSKLSDDREVILGVDTHLDQHVAVLIDSVGRLVGTRSISTNTAGYDELINCGESER